jgi:DNA polymerase epsilon subunit 1
MGCVAHYPSATIAFDIYDGTPEHGRRVETVVDATEHIVDIREYDVPYHVRVAIDKGNL